MKCANPSPSTLLAELAQRPLRPGEASTFFHHPEFNLAAVKVMPGEYFVDDTNVVITTTLGSCVTVCLYDPRNGISGMNHFMLPTAEFDGASGRTGVHAMARLLRELAARGAGPSHLQAKVFGGGQVIKGLDARPVGELNVDFVRAYLAHQRIPILAEDVLGASPRKIALFVRTGKVLCKRLPAAHGAAIELQENQYKAPQPLGGWVGSPEVLS